MNTRHSMLCLAEDRAGAEIGIRIALLSIERHCGSIPITIYRPNPTPEFTAWVKRFPEVRLETTPLPNAFSWNCKPQALLSLLRQGWQEVIWFDSDMMLAQDYRPLFANLSEDTISITQEAASMAHQGTRHRTEAWGFPVGRELAFTLNSSIVRVTQKHEAFLDAWEALLSRPSYIEVQKLPVNDRPVHQQSDQDVFNALIGSSEFAKIPLRVIASGKEIIHCGGALGYSIGERFRGLSLKPTFLHAIAGKPWVLLLPENRQAGWFGWYRRLLQEISPYVLESRAYRKQIGEESPWLDYGTALGRSLRIAGGEHYALSGLLPTVAATMIQWYSKAKA